MLNENNKDAFDITRMGLKVLSDIAQESKIGDCIEVEFNGRKMLLRIVEATGSFGVINRIPAMGDVRMPHKPTPYHTLEFDIKDQPELGRMVRNMSCNDPNCLIHKQGGLLDTIGVPRTEQKPVVEPEAKQEASTSSISPELAKHVAKSDEAMRAVYFASRSGWSLYGADYEDTALHFERGDVRIRVYWNSSIGQYALTSHNNGQLLSMTLGEKDLETYLGAK